MVDGGSVGNPKGACLVLATALLAGAWLLAATGPAGAQTGASLTLNDTRVLQVNETVFYDLNDYFSNGDTLHIVLSITSPGEAKMWISSGGQMALDSGINVDVDLKWDMPTSGDYDLYVKNVGNGAGSLVIKVEKQLLSEGEQQATTWAFTAVCLFVALPLLVIGIIVIILMVKRRKTGSFAFLTGRGQGYEKQRMQYGPQYGVPPGQVAPPNEGLYIPPSEPEDIKDRR